MHSLIMFAYFVDRKYFKDKLNSAYSFISWRCFMSDGMDHFSQRGVNSLYLTVGMFLHCVFNYSV